MRGRCQPSRFPEALQICCQKSAARNLTSAASAEPRSPRWHLRWRLRRRLRRRSDGCRQPAPERPPRADAPFVCLDLIGLDPHEFLSAETWKAHVQRSAVSVGSAAGRLPGTRGTSKAPVDHSLPSAGFSRPPSPPPDHRRPHQSTVIPTRPPSSPPDHRRPHQTTVVPPRPPSSPPDHRRPHQREPPQRRPPKPRGDRSTYERPTPDESTASFSRWSGTSGRRGCWLRRGSCRSGAGSARPRVRWCGVPSRSAEGAAGRSR